MIKKKSCISYKKEIFSLLFLELLSLLLCISVGYFYATSSTSETSVTGIIITYLFLSMALVPFIHKRFILKKQNS